MREADLERKCVKLAKERGGLLLKWTCPGTAGVHDRLLFYMGYIIPIELKRPTGRLTKLQQLFHRKLDDMRIEHYTVRTIDDFTAVLNSIYRSE